VTHARLRRLSALVGWALYLVAGVGLLLHWGVAVWLLTGAGMLAIQWSHGFGRRKSSQ
jgi:Flp pilus assembly protein TadB